MAVSLQLTAELATRPHIAVMAGVSRSTVKTAVRQAVALGILTSEEWRLTAWRNAPNTVRIISPEWRAWLRMRDRKRAADHPRHAEQGGGVRSSTTLRITDSTRKEMPHRTAPKRLNEGRKGAIWSS